MNGLVPVVGHGPTDEQQLKTIGQSVSDSQEHDKVRSIKKFPGVEDDHV